MPGALSAALRLAAPHRCPPRVDPAPRGRARRASRPARCRRCCPAAARSPTPRRASTSPRCGASTQLPADARAASTGEILARRRRRAASAALVVGGVEPARPAGPGARARRARPRCRSSSRSRCAASEVTERADVVLPGRAAGREGRHVRHLGGPPAAVPAGARPRTRDGRPPGAGPARRRAGRRPRAADARRPCTPSSTSSAAGTAPASRHPPSPAAEPPAVGAGPGGPRDLAPAARRGPAAGRRGVPRRHRASGRSPGSRRGTAAARRRRRRRRCSRSRPTPGRSRCPCVVTDMPDHVVWLPTNSPGCAVRDTLRADAGDRVRLAPAPRRRRPARADGTVHGRRTEAARMSAHCCSAERGCRRPVDRRLQQRQRGGSG